MAVKLKAKKLTFAEMQMLMGSLLHLNTPNLNEARKLEGLEKKLIAEMEKVPGYYKEFKAAHGLGEDDNVEDASHPLFSKWNEHMSQQPTTLSLQNTAIYSDREFSAAIYNCNFKYSTVKILKEWLLKLETNEAK